MFNVPRRFAGIKRFREILSILSLHGLDFALERTGLKKKKMFTKEYPSRPVEVRMIFEELGGTFIKLGQFLSLRSDLVPKEYCDELSKLQDSVEGFSYREVENIVKFELKKPLKAAFREFDKVPVAAASIGQVHLARLRNGKKVAVKVMRPGIRATFETDLEIIEYFARLIKHHFNPRIFDPEEIFEEFRRYTEGELDYIREAKSIRLFHEAFSDGGEIIVPEAYSELSTRRVLVMERIEGIPLSRILLEPGKYRVDRSHICRVLAHGFMRQVFLMGLFHADPHPGNIFISGKDVALLDFGIVGRADLEMKEKLGTLFISLVNKDTDGIVASMISLNLVDMGVDASSLKQKIVDELGEYYDVPLEKMDIAEMFFKCISIAREYHIKIPRDFVLLAKCLITLRTICAQLDPKFNIVSESRPFMAQLVKERKKPANLLKRVALESQKFAMFLKDLPVQSRKFYGVLDKADSTLDTINRDISRLTREVRRESIRLVVTVIVAALIISASFTTSIDKRLSNLFIIFAGLFLGYLFLSIVSDGFRREAQ